MKTLYLSIDEILIEEIESGKTELTDALFFECLEEHPDYLATKPFIEKIGSWRDQLAWAVEPEKQKIVEKKFNALTKALKGNYKRRAKPSLDDKDITLVSKYDEIVKKLGEFAPQNKDLTKPKIRDSFDETFPEWKELNPFKVENKKPRPKSTSALAYRILAAYEGYKNVNKVQSAVKNGRETLNLTRALSGKKI